jgi:hypothetical protein
LVRACHAKLFGSNQKQEKLALLPRPPYAYGMMRAAEWARNCGRNAVTVCEFGLASGDGLAAMVDLAARLGREMGVRFRVCGFDGAVGLPKPQGFKDHPEIWEEGAFLMRSPDALKRRFAGKAEIFWGDITQTVDAFKESLTPESPLGFVSVDVDQYGSAVAVLRCLDLRPEVYNPGVSVYFDDVEFFTNCDWAGELAAIREFNEGNERRKLGVDRSLPGPRRIPYLKWYSRMYVAQILDHPRRNPE